MTLDGWFKPREYDSKDGQKKLALEIVAQKLEVSPPRGDAAEPTDNGPVTKADDPWNLDA